MIPKLQPDTEGVFNDLITVAIYPPILAESISPQLTAMSLAATRLMVIPAVMIRVDGEIILKGKLGITDFDLLNLIALQIQNDLNPPNGSWGNQSFESSLTETLLKIDGVNSVVSMLLKDFDTGISLSEKKIYPWHLFEVQQSMKIIILRS